MNSLEFEVQRSKVKVMTPEQMVHVGGGMYIDSSLLVIGGIKKSICILSKIDGSTQSLGFPACIISFKLDLF